MRIGKFTNLYRDVTKEGTKIQQEKYCLTGQFPIVDQGQRVIAGWWNDDAGIFKDVPAIIFGDHTRAIKYMEEPFFIGADGVKILRPTNVKDNPKYLYYALQAAKIPNLGYSRHFKVVKELEIRMYSRDEQDEIVRVLEKIDYLIEQRHAETTYLDQLVKSRFIELFGAISEEVPLSYYIGGLNAGKSLAGEEENPNKVLKTGAATYDYFDETQIKNLPIDYEPQENHRVKAGDVIISRMNTAELVGAAAYVWDIPEHIYLPDRLWRAEIKETANPIFVWQVLIQSSTKESIRRIASGTSGSMKNISKPGLLGIRVVKAPIELQEQFAAFVEQTDKSKLCGKMEVAA